MLRAPMKTTLYRRDPKTGKLEAIEATVPASVETRTEAAILAQVAETVDPEAEGPEAEALARIWKAENPDLHRRLERLVAPGGALAAARAVTTAGLAGLAPADRMVALGLTADALEKATPEDRDAVMALWALPAREEMAETGADSVPDDAWIR